MATPFSALKKQVSEFAAANSEKLNQRSAILAQITELESAPPRVSDVLADVEGYIDSQASRYAASLKTELAPYLKSAKKTAGSSPLELLHLHQGSKNAMPSFSESPAGLFYLLNSQIKAGVKSAMAAFADAPGAISRAERLARLDQLRQQLAEIDAELQELKTLASQLGIAIPERPLSADEIEAQRLVANRERRAAENARIAERKARFEDKLPNDF